MLATSDRELTGSFLVLFFQEWIYFNRESLCNVNLWKSRHWRESRKSYGIYYLWEGKCSIMEVPQSTGLRIQQCPFIKNCERSEICILLQASEFTFPSFVDVAKDTRLLHQKVRIITHIRSNTQSISIFWHQFSKPHSPQGIVKRVRWQHEQWVALKKRTPELRESNLNLLCWTVNMLSVSLERHCSYVLSLFTIQPTLKR